MPESAGVDPGFTRGAGSPVWELVYKPDENGEAHETIDGRNEIPENTIAYQEIGCSLDTSTKKVKSEEDYISMLDEYAREEEEYSMFLFGSQKSAASTETSQRMKEGFSHNMKYLFSTAECLAYRAEMPRYGCRPGYTADYQAGANTLLMKLSEYEQADDDDAKLQKEEALMEEFYNFFDSFGTHTMDDIVFGSRFTLKTTWTAQKFDSVATSSHFEESTDDLVKENTMEKCGMDCKMLDAGLEVAKDFVPTPGLERLRRRPRDLERMVEGTNDHGGSQIDLMKSLERHGSTSAKGAFCGRQAVPWAETGERSAPLRQLLRAASITAELAAAPP
jgi:hypothetical protein